MNPKEAAAKVSNLSGEDTYCCMNLKEATEGLAMYWYKIAGRWLPGGCSTVQYVQDRATVDRLHVFYR